MSPFETRIELCCDACDWREVCDLATMRARLVDVGTLRRATDPEPALVLELFRAHAMKMPCPDCGSPLTADREVDQDDWDDDRSCEACGQKIAAARLAALPSATRCATCQAKLDRGEPAGEAEYCSRCGGVMVLKQTTGRAAEYVMRCGECGR